MNKVEYIKSRIDVEQILDYYSVDWKYHGRMIRSACSIHSGDNDMAFVVDPEEMVYYCHTRCGEGGDIITYVQKMEEIGFVEALNRIAEICDIDLDGIDFTEIKREDFQFANKEFIKQFKKSQVKRKKLPPYSVKGWQFSGLKGYRGLSDEALKHFRIAYCEEGKLKGRVAIPFYDLEGTLVGLTGRRADNDTTKPKFYHVPYELSMGSFMPFAKNNLDSIKEKDEIVVVEGIFDVARLWDAGIKNAVSPIGVFFTEDHVKICAELATTLVLGMDGDKAGRNGMRKAIKLAKYMFDLYVIPLPEGKDFGDLTLEEAKQAYDSKIHYSQWLRDVGDELEK